ncbi:hypothetical protein EV356DRAFT_501552 [Viridothelium virens]|uniref:Uncharacterized protein n=1 Tax=Viridothelium virens TaxID=1048519 RepID=A0A6A6HAY9_VIRVR|nr:hypothetical protein EV356DRAFT_501552 [Viridothelium virens]
MPHCLKFRLIPEIASLSPCGAHHLSSCTDRDTAPYSPPAKLLIGPLSQDSLTLAADGDGAPGRNLDALA